MKTERLLTMNLRALSFLVVATASCGADPSLKVTNRTDWHSFVRSPQGGPAGGDVDQLRFRPNLCEPEALKPDYAMLDQSSLVRFLEEQHIDVRIERPRADLIYLNLTNAGTQRPVRLRVAILKNADEAGRELHEAILQHGPGSWGVHRSNLAILGPVGDLSDDINFAATTRLACWGVFTIASTDDTFVVPGAYTEL